MQTMEKHIELPLTEEIAAGLAAGDYLYLSGIVYTARDAAHKRMQEALQAGEELPFSVKDQVIYYLGPSPARPGHVIGSAGPTTSSRMDKYTPELLDRGLKGMIGKGRRSQEVIESMKKNRCVYMAAIGVLERCCQNASSLRKSLPMKILEQKLSESFL